MKISRRELAAVALAGAGSAQTPPAQTLLAQGASKDEDLQAQQQVARNSETLLKFEIPMAAEPSFQFKA